MKNLKKSIIKAMFLCMAVAGVLATSCKTIAAESDFVIKDGVLTA